MPFRPGSLRLVVLPKHSQCRTYPYAWRFPPKCNPSDRIALKFGSEEVKIIGRNLNAEIRPNVRLFCGIVRHRVPWIQEADRPTAIEAGRGAVVVEDFGFNK